MGLQWFQSVILFDIIQRCVTHCFANHHSNNNYCCQMLLLLHKIESRRFCFLVSLTRSEHVLGQVNFLFHCCQVQLSKEGNASQSKSARKS